MSFRATHYGQTLPPPTAATATATTSEPETEAIPCDLDNDGQVGLGDLAFFSSVYGEQPGVTTENPYAYAADFDGSGTVDINDLGIFSTLYRQGRLESSIASPADVSQPGGVSPETSFTAANIAVTKNQKQAVAAWTDADFNDDKMSDNDVAILAMHWMTTEGDTDEEDARDSIFAEVGPEDHQLGWLDE